MSVVFRAQDEPMKTRLDYWQHVMRGVLGPVDLQAPDHPDFRDRLVLGELGPLKVGDVSVTGFDEGKPGHCTRTRRHVRRSDGHDLCWIGVQAGVCNVIEQHGRRAVAEPGDLVLVDLAEPWRYVGGPSRLAEIVVPRSLVPLPADDLARATGVRIPGGRGPGALVSSLARQLPARLDDTDRSHAARLGTAVLDLFTVALATHLDRGRAAPPATRQRALLVEIHAFIEAHLGDPDLSPSTIAAAHFVSLRYLHKLFETEETTVAERIRRRRLERCRQDLLDPARRAEPVATIAARWGFADPAHFSRVFRATHGMPPAQYRRLAGRRPGSPPAP
jgi:AraC-like DNA-binding protein